MTKYEIIKTDTLTARLVSNKTPNEENTIKKNTMLSILSDCEAKGKVSKRPPTDEECVGILKSFLKKCNQFIDDVSSVSDPDLEKIKKLTQEKEVLMSYLPKELTVVEILSTISGCSNLGVAMKKLKTEYFGEYDGKTASKICKDYFLGKS